MKGKKKVISSTQVVNLIALEQACLIPHIRFLMQKFMLVFARISQDVGACFFQLHEDQFLAEHIYRERQMELPRSNPRNITQPLASWEPQGGFSISSGPVQHEHMQQHNAEPDTHNTG